MPIQELSLRTIPEVDCGKIDAALSNHLRRAVLDCIDRPADLKPRKVVLEFLVTPETDQNGVADRTGLEFQIRSTVPAHRSRVISCEARRNGSLAFNADSLGDVRQATFDMGDAAPPQHGTV